MRTCDVKCEGEVQDDGTVTIIISVSGLNMGEAKSIGDRFKDPFRKIVDDVLSLGGSRPIERRDLLKRTQ
jgi:hypothetical protein